MENKTIEKLTELGFVKQGGKPNKLNGVYTYKGLKRNLILLITEYTVALELIEPTEEYGIRLFTSMYYKEVKDILSLIYNCRVGWESFVGEIPKLTQACQLQCLFGS